jgi:hypothetical protein
MLATLAFPLECFAKDSKFLKKFSSYRAKNRISTFDTARVFATHYKTTPQKVLKRYIAAAFEVRGAYEPALVLAIDAFKESGLSHQMALTHASDSVGQMTDTLDAIYNQTKNRSDNRIASRDARPARGPASVVRVVRSR